MENFKIVVVEDDVMYGEILEFNLSLNPDWVVEKYTTGKDLLSNLFKNPSVISLDYSLPDMTGLEVLEKIKKYNPDIPVIVVSGQEDVGTAVDLLKKGVYDYIVKDADTKDRLWNAMTNIRENAKLKQEISDLKEEIGKKYEFSSVIKGNSLAIKKVFKLLEKAAKTNITVSLTGETGTGKELLAQEIHNMSRRKNRPMVTVNCAALPSDLVESELFGHEKGAFTGAQNRRIGRFELSDGSTLFLDEIGELSLGLQAKLLRVLQMKQFERVGGQATIHSDARVIAATNRDLAKAVHSGDFRMDLFYRLNVFPIIIPPLREHPEDIPALAWFFTHSYCEKMGKRIDTIPAGRMRALQNYRWPGNVRELKNIIERAVIISGGRTLHIEIPGDTVPLGPTKPRTLSELQREHILETLKSTGWRIRGNFGAARILGLKPTTLESRMAKLGIKRPPKG